MQSTTSVLECSHCRRGAVPATWRTQQSWACAQDWCQCRWSTLLLGIPLTSSFPHFSPESCLWQADSSSVTITRLKTRNALRTRESVSLNRKAVLWYSKKTVPDGPRWHSTTRNSKTYFKQRKSLSLGLPAAKQWEKAVAVSSTWPSVSFQFTLFYQSATGWIIYKQWMFSGHIILGAGKYKNMSNQ